MTVLKDISHLLFLAFKKALHLFNIRIFTEPTEIETQMRNEKMFNKTITLLFTNSCHIWATILLQVFLGHFWKKTLVFPKHLLLS